MAWQRCLRHGTRPRASRLFMGRDFAGLVGAGEANELPNGALTSAPNGGI
jgi:hypothetical protein